MATQVLRGSLQPFLQNEYFDFDPQHGYVHRFDFKGMSRDLMLAEQQYYVQNGIACRLGFLQGGNATLEIEDSTQQFVLDTWQIVGNEESRDIFSHPTVLSICTDDQVGAIRAGIESIESATTTSVAINTILAKTAFTGISAGDKIILGRFIGLHLRGSTEYRRGQYVLRHTTNAPNRWTSNISDFGVDKIYTPAQLLTEVQDASLWIAPLAARLVYKIGLIPVPASKANYQWGWLKSASTETTGANNRIEISQEYCLEQWSLDTYSAY